MINIKGNKTKLSLGLTWTPEQKKKKWLDNMRKVVLILAYGSIDKLVASSRW